MSKTKVFDVQVTVRVEARESSEAAVLVQEAVNSDAFANLRTLNGVLVSQQVNGVGVEVRDEEPPLASVSADEFKAWLEEKPERLELARKRCHEASVEAQSDDRECLADNLWLGVTGYKDYTADDVIDELKMLFGEEDDSLAVAKQELEETLREQA